MLLKDVKRLPLYEELTRIVNDGKRNLGKVPYPNYYGVPYRAPDNITRQWNNFKKHCTQMMRDDKLVECQALMDSVNQRHWKNQNGYETQRIMYYIQINHRD